MECLKVRGAECRASLKLALLPWVYSTHLHIDFLDAMRDDYKHIPAPNSRKGQSIIFSTAELDTEPNQVDLTDFAVPIDNLLEPEIAEGALRALDQIVIENMGTQLGLWRATQKPRDIH
ncbi:hypothetical protein HD806DRAFT_536005 [Xylariaceae sp. AK1471]|nr:hypothetical protein HD806DRAFT_536005 [Xylariaceae sp. AK1471]